VQVFGDGQGRVLTLGERDCSLQRRNQKVLEESPAPGLDDATRRNLADAARQLCERVSYRSAGTVEFLLDADSHQSYFLEVNTRLQVEHGVTEEVFGIDLVEWMIRLAGGEDMVARQQDLTPRGHAIEARIYAEDSARDFRPSIGTLIDVRVPDGIRCDTWVAAGTEVTPHYDPLLAKLIVHADDRAAAVAAMQAALAETAIWGVETNLPLLRRAVQTGPFAEGRPSTAALADIPHATPSVEVVAPGMLSTLQDLAGRVGLWHVGVPPSGPMDNRSHALANALLGNPDDAPVLEMTRIGPHLRFGAATTICLTGADMDARLNGAPAKRFAPVAVAPGDELHLGTVVGAGARTYLAVAGGFAAPTILGSTSTFVMGRFGGHAGRALRTGDVLRLHPDAGPVATDGLGASPRHPEIGNQWTIDVLYGPHAAPDFFTPASIQELLTADWRVHHNSDRTGVRLVGPMPQWTRADGGEAGLHPSNIHDTPYAVGAIDFTGDMPVILGPDGPSLGGFVCPMTVPGDELWKLGQLSPGDTVRFSLRTPPSRHRIDAVNVLPTAILARETETADRPQVVYRRSGDANLLVEFGEQMLDINLRMRAHLLMRALEQDPPPGLIDMTPGVRSLQIHVDPRRTDIDRTLAFVHERERAIGDISDAVVPSRTVHLPLAWEDPEAMRAIDRYMHSVRADAPWCPDNIEFIRRINGLDHVDDVRRIVYEASYLVLGLGDVYLGAPVATPVDPRHRLVTTKYNPARTWTPENAVGIGGAYMCVYGMEGPGGYQLVGRTVPVWNTYGTNPNFADNTPWLLRFFDRISFVPVSAEELVAWRRGVRDGSKRLVIEDGTFSLADHHRFLHDIADESAIFRATQRQAFDEERSRWALMPEADDVVDEPLDASDRSGTPVYGGLAANVWKLNVALGDRVATGDVVAVLEAMKMEVEVRATCSGVVSAVLCKPGELVDPDQPLFTVEAQ
jgi:urea carboxylase